MRIVVRRVADILGEYRTLDLDPPVWNPLTTAWTRCQSLDGTLPMPG